jgi:8-oxo-dGTP diphosphatase
MAKYLGGASAFIIHKDKILLFHRDNFDTIAYPDCWALPGGKIEKGETPLEAVRRELEEEVSYAPQSLKYIGKIVLSPTHTGYFYMAFVSDAEASLFKHGAGEGQGIGFFTIDEMGNLKLPRLLGHFYEKYKDVFERVIENSAYPEASAIGLDDTDELVRTF